MNLPPDVPLPLGGRHIAEDIGLADYIMPSVVSLRIDRTAIQPVSAQSEVKRLAYQGIPEASRRLTARFRLQSFPQPERLNRA